MSAPAALLFLIIIVTANAESSILLVDTKEPALTEEKCPATCDTLMNAALVGIKFALGNIITHIPFHSGFCQCEITDKGEFNYTYSCATDSESEVFDHTLQLHMDDLKVECSCSLPSSPAAAAETINNVPVAAGKCGSESLVNKIENKALTCESDSDCSDTEDTENIKVTGDFKGAIVNVVIRVDTITKQAFPLNFGFISPKENAFSLTEGSGFEAAWDCLNNDENRETFVRKMLLGAFKTLFDCMDDEEGHEPSIIHALLYNGGNCNKFQLGR